MAWKLPSDRLVDVAIILDSAPSPRLVPASGIKRGDGSLVANNEMEASLHSCKNTFQTERHSICRQKNRFDIRQPMVLDSKVEGSEFLSDKNFSPPQFTQEILLGLIHKTKQRRPCPLSSMMGGFRRGIDTQVDISISQRTQLPGPFWPSDVNLENPGGLVDAEAFQISQKVLGGKVPNHLTQSDRDVMPQAIVANKG